ncbi:uncharacterized protein LOC141901347 [Tubulanus polymorphus]|uniref:uncharacterized protein LOC141901347 n=1 Tax=Tubulanus polymorphus TaxID=672921 RepID=UPI003DA4F197
MDFLRINLFCFVFLCLCESSSSFSDKTACKLKGRWRLDCSNQHLTVLRVPDKLLLTEIRYLDLSYNHLNSIDVDQILKLFPALRTLDVRGNHDLCEANLNISNEKRFDWIHSCSRSSGEVRGALTTRKTMQAEIEIKASISKNDQKQYREIVLPRNEQLTNVLIGTLACIVGLIGVVAAALIWLWWRTRTPQYVAPRVVFAIRSNHVNVKV